MKNTIYILISFLIITLSNTSILAQNNSDEELANQYFYNKEFDKAVIYYEKLFNKSHNQTHYLKLLDCFVALEEYKNAEKLIKNQQRKHPYELNYNVDLAYLYNVSGKPNDAKQLSEKTIKQLSPNQQQVISLAQAFQFRKENDYAIQTYLQGRKLLKDMFPFNFELAQLYSNSGKTEQMLNEYLDILVVQESYIQSVQNALQTNLSDDDKGTKKDLLKTLLLKYIQTHPDRKVFSEMLIWVYIQEENYLGAFTQAKALDKRFKEYGDRLMALGHLSAENKDYETAIKCYQYVISKGLDSYYYVSAKMELVNVYTKKITSTNNFTATDLAELERSYQSSINELGKSVSTTPLLRGYANFQSFYLHQPENAISLLNEVLVMPGISAHEIAQTKIELADVYLFVGEIWEASLLYSQVEKAYKYDQLGETAKFKNAKISFYTGDFAWSKAQLDVLKASTSKLIANDAMQLSLLITDNIGIDTNEAPLLLFAKADLLSYQNKNDEAIKLLDSLKNEFSYHSINDDVLFKRFQINYKQQQFDAALENLNEIITNYPTDLLGDDALYNAALIYDNNKNDPTKAAELYKSLLFDYKDSVYGVDARKRYRELKGDINIIKIENDILEFEAN
ncbi:MAG: tetratricopeptide repeat protein [Flavobacteriales bacterium]|nr:MAG: tetratricopeptide repeat protein [Flavobacteriales bacterium]